MTSVFETVLVIAKFTACALYSEFSSMTLKGQFGLKNVHCCKLEKQTLSIH